MTEKELSIAARSKKRKKETLKDDTIAVETVVEKEEET